MINSICKTLKNIGVKYIVIMPDSMNSALLKLIQDYTEVEIIQVLNETDVITISSGLNLTGNLAIAIFENSGIRSVCDILTRFEMSHNIHNIYLLSSRGGIGEANWWGVMHKKVTLNILDETNILHSEINSIQEFEVEINKAITTFKTEQISVALNLTPCFFKNLYKQ